MTPKREQTIADALNMIRRLGDMNTENRRTSPEDEWHLVLSIKAIPYLQGLVDSIENELNTIRRELAQQQME